jgi:hypothetical protein
MKARMTRGVSITLALLGLAVLLIVPQCLLFPESGFVGEPAPNEMPRVKITGGVLLDSVSTTARVRFYWFGSDNDGMIRWFEWAIDDTISEQAWHRTTEYSVVIPFQATDWVDGTPDADPTDEEFFDDWHAFYVRSVDNDYARSRASKRFFNTRTIAPTTEITRPEQRDTDESWASTLKVTWLGDDPDGSRADKQPSGFEYKLVRFEGAWNPGDISAIRARFRDSPNQLLDSLRVQDYPDDPAYFAEAKRGWIRVPGDSNSRWLNNLSENRRYGFAVRAIDEAGAVEPELGWNNWIIFNVQDRVIDVYVSEPSLGMRKFNSSTYSTWEVNVAPEQRIRFRWEGDASDNGTEAGPCNYGFDIPEPDEEINKDVGGIGGWIGWAVRSQLDQSISFPRADEGTTHNFYLKMRAVSMSLFTETKCHVAIHISRLSFSKKFYYVDDQRRAPRGCLFSTPKPNDGQSDALRDRLFASMAEYLPENQTPGVYEAYGPRDEDANPSLPDDGDLLGLLGEYQTVIWDMGTTGENFYRIAGLRGDLSRYRGAGGNLLMLMDQGPISPYTNEFQQSSADPYCPNEALTSTELWNVFSFPYVHLHLRGCVDKPRDDLGSLGFRRMTMVRAKAENPLYPDLELNWNTWGCANDNRGVWHYEVLWPDTQDPDEIPWYESEPGLEILYRSRTFSTDARLDSLPVVWRTFATREDSLSGIYPGRAVVFAFHPWFFREEGVTGAMTQALRWVVTGSDF